MFPNLQAEMKRIDINFNDLSEYLKIDCSTISNKMNGKTEWKRKEMFDIQKKWFSSCTIDYLFVTKEKQE